MINFSIKELNAFAVIGQEVELTNYQKKNIQISTQFWRKFNSSLKKAYSFTTFGCIFMLVNASLSTYEKINRNLVSFLVKKTYNSFDKNHPRICKLFLFLL